MSIVTELVFWNDAANRRRGWNVSSAQAIASAAPSPSRWALTSRGSIDSPPAVVSAEACERRLRLVRNPLDLDRPGRA